VTFCVPADAYDRFMGRYSARLSAAFADLAGISSGQRVLDVGCGPGVLTSELVARAGSDAVTAVDPSEPFVAAVEARNPGVDVRLAVAEDLPFADGSFDAALAQLVVHFMTDPLRGLAEMRRVTRRDGVVAACVWDHGGGRGPLSPLWEAVREIEPSAHGESRLAGANAGDLTRLLAATGLRDVEEGALEVHVEHPTFEEWWEPFSLGVGPAGAYVAGLDADARARLGQRCRARLGDGPFAVAARAWACRGVG
jgi:SAM-dependent methyltransferase